VIFYETPPPQKKPDGQSTWLVGDKHIKPGAH